MPTNRAAIDIGTNSVHLLVAEVGDAGEFTVLTTDKETVRLGDSPGDIRELSDAAMDRGVAALRRFRVIADSFDATIDAVATSAVREADNGPVFVERAASEAGINIDVISGPEEGRLIHLGVLQALPVFEQQLLMVDIGGGSTELLIGMAGRSLAVRSLRIGHLRLTNRFFPDGVITPESVEACRLHARAFLVPAVNSLRPLGYQIAVGSSGTIEAIGDMVRLRSQGDVGNPGLDTVIDRQGLHDVVQELAQWSTPEERADKVAGLADKRADVIVGGAILLQEIFAAFAIEHMVTSPYALREGVLLDRTIGIEGGQAMLADLRRESLMRMVEAFDEDPSHVEHATELALQMFDQMVDQHRLGGNERELLEAAGLLHNVGLFVSHAAHHQHSEYIIRNNDRLAGYTEREVELIAQVARYHRRSQPKKSHPRFMALGDADRELVRWLAGFLRIAIALDRTRQAAVKAVDVQVGEGSIALRVQVPTGGDASVELFTARDRCKLLASISGRTVSLS